MNRKQAVTAWIFRLVGLSGMLAIVAVVMPFSWMAETHEYLGLGKMPEGAIVEYLARSLSAVYVVLGVVLWKVSFRFAQQLELVRLLRIRQVSLMLGWLPRDRQASLELGWLLHIRQASLELGWLLHSCG